MKDIKWLQAGKEEFKVSLFPDWIFYIRTLKSPLH